MNSTKLSLHTCTACQYPKRHNSFVIFMTISTTILIWYALKLAFYAFNYKIYTSHIEWLLWFSCECTCGMRVSLWRPFNFLSHRRRLLENKNEKREENRKLKVFMAWTPHYAKSYTLLCVRKKNFISLRCCLIMLRMRMTIEIYLFSFLLFDRYEYYVQNLWI